MKKYEKKLIPLPLYSEEYKQHCVDEGRDYFEFGDKRTAQWVGEVLDQAIEEFDLSAVKVFRILQDFQYMCFRKNDIKMSQYMSDLIQETKTEMLSELGQKGENPKYTLLHDWYTDGLSDWYDEVCEWDQVPELPKPSPEEEPELLVEDEPDTSNVITLKPTKRASIIDV